MNNMTDKLKILWESRLCKEHPHKALEKYQSIVRWLLGENCDRLEKLSASELAIAKQEMDYRYRILQQRYLDIKPEQAYRHLLTRLASLVIQRYQILSLRERTAVSNAKLTREHYSALTDQLQALLQEMLHQDAYLQHQMIWIAQCTQDPFLGNALLFTSFEEYCLRPVHNQPLIVKRFVNFIRRQLLKDKINPSQRDVVHLFLAKVNRELADFPEIPEPQETHHWEKQHQERIAVQQTLEHYLAQKGGMLEVRWLKLYLQGRSPEAIAQILNLSLRQVSRLRETVKSHALEVFLRPQQPELMSHCIVNESA